MRAELILEFKEIIETANKIEKAREEKST